MGEDGVLAGYLLITLYYNLRSAKSLYTSIESIFTAV